MFRINKTKQTKDCYQYINENNNNPNVIEKTGRGYEPKTHKRHVNG